MNNVEFLKAIQLKIYRDTLTYEQTDQIAEDIFELVSPLLVNHFERESLDNGDKKSSSLPVRESVAVKALREIEKECASGFAGNYTTSSWKAVGKLATKALSEIEDQGSK